MRLLGEFSAGARLVPEQLNAEEAFEGCYFVC